MIMLVRKYVNPHRATKSAGAGEEIPTSLACRRLHCDTSESSELSVNLRMENGAEVRDGGAASGKLRKSHVGSCEFVSSEQSLN